MDELHERWYTFINSAYVEFRGPTRKTISDFANAIGFSQALMSQYMKLGGKIPRSQSAVQKLVRYFGPVIYEVLDIEPSDTGEDLLPSSLRSMVSDITDALKERGLAPDSPEAEEVVIEIMKRHGYKHTSTTDDERVS